MKPTRYALFDVDGTLTRGTTLFRFLEYFMAARGLGPQAYQKHRAELAALRAAGASRSVTNKAHFRAYAGLDAARVARTARDWFEAEQRQGQVFHEEVVDRLIAHRRSGYRVVLVSGSCTACLTPIADLLQVDDVLCSRPTLRAGRYTGQIDRPMIGAEKADAVRRMLLRGPVHEIWAYGDDVSDLPLLELATDPVVVGDAPGMRDVAAHRAWGHLPTHGQELPVPMPGLTAAHGA